jgi:hypothetical protein
VSLHISYRALVGIGVGEETRQHKQKDRSKAVSHRVWLLAVCNQTGGRKEGGDAYAKAPFHNLHHEGMVLREVASRKLERH